MKLVIFDFDGTLVDSRKLIWESHRIVFEEFGLPRPSREQSLSLIGMSLELVLERLAGADAPIAQMTAAYQRLLPILREDSALADAPFEGVSELLTALAARENTTLALATGHVSQAIEPVLDKLGWRKFFRSIQTADRAPSKPHPAMLLQALRETGVAKDDAVMIGDTVFDMEMASAAGVEGIGVSWGYHQAERLRAAGAARVATHIAELHSFLAERR